MHNHRGRPAFAVDERIPRFSQRHALNPDEQRAETHGDVDRDDDKPDYPFEPSVGESEEGKSKTGFGPCRGREGKRAGNVDGHDGFARIINAEGYIVDAQAVAERCSVGEKAGFGGDADLF